MRLLDGPQPNLTSKQKFGHREAWGMCTQRHDHVNAPYGSQGEGPNLPVPFLDFQPPELQENEFVLLELLRVWYFVIAAVAS